MSLVVTLGIGHSLRSAYQAALPPGARLAMGIVGGFSDRYVALARSQSLPAFLRSQGWDGAEPVALVCFSAGCWAPREWMRDPANQALAPLALVLLDGLHGGSGAECSLDAIGGIVAFGKAARADPRARLLVVTSTAIVPPYASTTACATLLLDQLGIRHRKPDAGEAAGVTVLDYGGTDAAAHNAQQTSVGPLLLRGQVGRWLQGKAPSRPWLWALGGLAAVTTVGIALVELKGT